MNEIVELKIYFCRCFNIGKYLRGLKVILEVKYFVRIIRFFLYKFIDCGLICRIVFVLMNNLCFVVIGFFYDEILLIILVCIRIVFI